ncbi:hypothetical protein [Frankia sp. Cppng1_Ct_nod]|uniref:hypothetical protein n=1 Tax=Frankia sp. Cppng1_Ct_nod TaxID=2897162 RepID=UPI0020241955|nr:hypothetical protein [Frankia sp. Cppng1_Ct_nod]
MTIRLGATAGRLLAGGIILATVGGISAAGIANAADEQGCLPPTISIVAASGGLDVTGAGHVRPGWTRVTASNPTDADHAFELVRLHDGVTVERFHAGLETPDGAAALSLADFYGGIDDVRHHTTWTMTVDLDRGHYVLVDHTQGPAGPDRPAWFTLPGFVRDFTVTGSHPTGARPPHQTATMVMRDFAFELPSALPRHGVVKVHSAGQLHAAGLLKFDPDVTIAQALTAVRGGQIPAGQQREFLGIVSPGHPLYVGYDLEPGAYLVVSFLPDHDHGGIPQAAQGMVAGFTVH